LAHFQIPVYTGFFAGAANWCCSIQPQLRST
jgi:hypothetical protein